MVKTVLEEVKERMQEMQTTKAAELDTISQKKKEAQAQKEAAELAIKAAVESMDLEAYEEGKAAQRRAQAALDMYTAKYTQLSRQEYISEAESDRVIDSLLAYEEELAADFKAAIVEPLKKLDALRRGYSEAVEDTENTIRAWTTNIHANHRQEGTIFADGTNRNPKSVPVHRLPYTGCNEAHRLAVYLKDEAGVLDA